MLVELEAAELLQALFALVLIVLARSVSSLCATRAHELSVDPPTGSFHLRAPRASITCCITFGASELRLTVPAHQAGLLSSLHGEQHVLVELEAAELLQAFLALVLVVPARRVSSLCTARAHEVSVESPMGSYHLTTPCASIKHVFAGRAPVVVGGQTILPTSVALGTKFAS